MKAFILTLLLALIVSRAVSATTIPLETLPSQVPARGTVVVLEVMHAQVPHVTVDAITIGDGGVWTQPASRDENVVWFVLAGAGRFTTRGEDFRFTDETIARVPLGWMVELRADPGSIVRALRVRKPLNQEDRGELSKLTLYQNEPYVRAFRDCVPYGEAIKSAKTISRTLLPEGVIPRMAAGTVETRGPDIVGRHQHPMLEQLFVGLRDNDSSVSADDALAPFPEFSILHIPLGSMHGARVADGKHLYYIWLDFFGNKAGQEWLKMHKPLAEKK